MKVLYQLILSISLAIVLVLGVVVFGIETMLSTKYASAVEQKVVETTRRYAESINTDMVKFKTISDTLTYALDKYDYSSPSRDEMNAMLKNIIVNNPNLLGIYTAFGEQAEGYSFDGKDAEYANTFCTDETGRFIPYWNRMGGDLVCEKLLNTETDDWYQIPFTTGKFTIFDPFIYEGVSMVSFIHPLKKGDDKIVGVAGVDVSLKDTDEMMNGLHIFNDDYAVLLSSKGVFMSHPTEKTWIGEKKADNSVFEGEDVDKMLSYIAMGKGGQIKAVEKLTGENVYLFFEPIETGNYSFVFVIHEHCLVDNVNFIRYLVFFTIGMALFILILFVVIISIVFTQKLSRLRDFASEIGSGNFDARTNIKSKDEVGELARVFERMALALKGSKKNLEMQNEELDKRVRDRTNVLNTKKKDLERFIKISVEKELTLIELKKKNKELEEKIKELEED